MSKIVDIDFTISVQEDETQVPTNQRICEDVPPPASFRPSDMEFFDLLDPSKPNMVFLKNHFYREGRITEEQALLIIQTGTALFRQEPNVLEVDPPITVCGDIHGQYYDLMKLFEVGGNFGDTMYLFLGNYVNRGYFSIECVLYLWALKIWHPKTLWLLRGNHECRRLTEYFTFKIECERKYSEKVYDACMESFCALPLAAIMNKQFLCIHGGLSPEMNTPDDLRAVPSIQFEPPLDGLMCDVLWSDPMDDFGSERTNDLFYSILFEEISTQFSYNAVCRFLDHNKLLCVIRAHEVQNDGYRMYRKTRKSMFPAVITIFSAPNYLDLYNNKASVFRYDLNTINIRQFNCMPHPYCLPNFLNAFSWSLPFVGKKITDMLISLLIVSLTEEFEEQKDVKPQTSEDPVTAAITSVEQQACRRSIKNKILALGRLSGVFSVLREGSERVSELKSVSEDVPPITGTLMAGSEGTRYIRNFNEARLSDLHNERLPPMRSRNDEMNARTLRDAIERVQKKSDSTLGSLVNPFLYGRAPIQNTVPIQDDEGGYGQSTKTSSAAFPLNLERRDRDDISGVACTALQTIIDSILMREPRSLYEECITAIALTSRNVRGIPAVHPSGRVAPKASIAEWGGGLLGSHIRFLAKPGISILLSLQKLLGGGNREVGKEVIAEMVQNDQRTEKFDDEFPTIFSPGASVVSWMLEMANLVCNKQVSRMMAVDTYVEGATRPTHPGECWKDAFGDPLIIDLSGKFDSLYRSGAQGRTEPLEWGHLLEDVSDDGPGTELVVCELEELILAIGGTNYVDVNGIVLVQGEIGLAVLVGQICNLPLWHVCSVQQASLFHNDPLEFVALIKDERTSLCKRIMRPPIQEFQKQFDPYSPRLIVVGALLSPRACNLIECSGLFESDLVDAGRERYVHSDHGLKWQRLSGQAQISMGVSGPQGSLMVGGEISRPTNWGNLLKEYALAQSPTILEVAKRNFIFVYQAASGQVVEQNLFSIVREIVSHTEGDAATITQTSTIWYNRLLSAGSAIDTISSAEVTLWARRKATMLRVCASLLSDPLAIVRGRTVGGIDLSLFIETDVKVRVYEQTSTLPLWARLLGYEPCVAVNVLRGCSPSSVRCSLCITIAGLERRLGKFLRETNHCVVFKSKDGVNLHLGGVDEHFVDLEQFKENVEIAIALRWDDEKQIYVPGERFGGRNPAILSFKGFRWFPWSRDNSQAEALSNIGLGELVNGSEISACFLGMMVECG